MSSTNSANALTLSTADLTGYEKAFQYCNDLAGKHQAEVGVLEAALGAGLLYIGMQSGVLNVGTDLFGSGLKEVAGMTAAATGGVAGPVVAMTFLKSIFVGGISGIAGVTLLPAVPVMVLAGGSAAVLGSFGYTAGGIAEDLLKPDLIDLISGASILAIGLALIVDGMRRIIKDERVLKALSSFKDGVVTLSEIQGQIIAKSMEEFKKIVAGLTKEDAAKLGLSAGTMATGAVLGGSLAAGSVTVLGSHALGSAAIALGVVSAPVWPIIAGGAIGLSLGALAFNQYRKYKADPLNMITPPHEIENKTV